MGDRILRGVLNYLRHESYSFCDEWVEGVVEFYLSEHENINTDDLNKFVVTQWLLADLRELASPCLPPQLMSERCISLPGKYALQVESMLDISTSCYTQYQLHTNADNANVEVQGENTFFKEPKANRMFMLSLTDGVQTITGVEHEPIRFLTQLIPGSKVMITGPVVCRRGSMLLTERHLNILGGEVESLLNRNALENVLARQLNLEENPDPYNQHPAPVGVPQPRANNQQVGGGDWGNEDIGIIMDNEIEDIEQRIRQEEEDARDAFSDDSDEPVFRNTGTTITQTPNFPNNSTATAQSQHFPNVSQRNNIQDNIPRGQNFTHNIPPRQNISNNIPQRQNVSSSVPQRQNFEPVLPRRQNVLENNDSRENNYNNTNNNARQRDEFPVNNNRDRNPVKIETERLLFDDDDDDFDFLQSIEELEMKATSSHQQQPTARSVPQTNAGSNRTIKSDPSLSADTINRQTASNFTNNTNHFKPSTSVGPTSGKVSPKTTPWLSCKTGSVVNASQSKNSAFSSASSVASKQTRLTAFMTKDKMSSSPSSKNLMASNKPITIGTVKPLQSNRSHDNERQLLTNQIQASSSASRQKTVRNDDADNVPEAFGTVKKSKLGSCTQGYESRVNESLAAGQGTSKCSTERCLPTMLSDPLDMDFDFTEPQQNLVESNEQLTVPERVKAITHSSTSSQPFVYLSQLEEQLHVTSRRRYTVKATVLTLVTKVSWPKDRWNITAKITDGSANLEVNFASEVLEKIMGLSVPEFKKMKTDSSSNPLLREKIVKVFKEAQISLMNLNCLFLLEFDGSSNLPQVVGLTDITEKHLNLLAERVKSTGAQL